MSCAAAAHVTAPVCVCCVCCVCVCVCVCTSESLSALSRRDNVSPPLPPAPLASALPARSAAITGSSICSRSSSTRISLTAYKLTSIYRAHYIECIFFLFRKKHTTRRVRWSALKGQYIHSTFEYSKRQYVLRLCTLTAQSRMCSL
jgi:hypothetical protein